MEFTHFTDKMEAWKFEMSLPAPEIEPRPSQRDFSNLESTVSE